MEIERATRKKPYLGGYRHKKTGVLYHHATAQTIKKQPPPSQIPKNCRDTQTVQQRHRVQQTTNDISTQMTGIGVFVSNMEDKLLVPGKYTTADEHKSMLLRKVSYDSESPPVMTFKTDTLFGSFPFGFLKILLEDFLNHNPRLVYM